MRTILVGLALAGVIALFSVGGVTPQKVMAWTAVIVGDVEDGVDRLLDEGQVMRQEALQAIEAHEKEMARLEKLLASSRVDARLTQEKVAALREVQADSQTELARLGRMIESGQEVWTDGDRTWTVSDLKSLATSKIAQYDLLVEQIAAYEENARIWDESASQTEAALSAARQNVTNMEALLGLLDAKLNLLRALEAQSEQAPRQNLASGQVLSETSSVLNDLIAEVGRATDIQRELNGIQAPIALDLPPDPASDDDLVAQLFERSGAGQ